MNIGNIYKKLCFVMILAGLILCSGRCVYAHNSEIIEVINALKTNPTIESLEYLACLFEDDVEYHQARGEITEANRARTLAVSVRTEIAIQSKINPTEEDYKEIIALLKLETELWSNIEDTKRAADSLMHMKQYKAKLGSLRATNALLKVQENPTAENWEMLSRLSNEQSILYNEAGDSKLSKYCLAQAIRFKATAVLFRAKENSTIQNWTETAKLYGEAFKIYYEIGDLTLASLCANDFVYSDNMIIKLGGNPIIPPTESDKFICFK